MISTHNLQTSKSTTINAVIIIKSLFVFNIYYFLKLKLQNKNKIIPVISGDSNTWNNFAQDYCRTEFLPSASILFMLDKKFMCYMDGCNKEGGTTSAFWAATS